MVSWTMGNLSLTNSLKLPTIIVVIFFSKSKRVRNEKTLL